MPCVAWVFAPSTSKSFHSSTSGRYSPRTSSTRSPPASGCRSSSFGCRDSMTAFSGRINTSSATLTDMPSRMASVSGSKMRMVVPLPALDWISTWPPISWMFLFTTSMPTPRPETSVTCSAVEKPGAKISMPTSSSDMFSFTAIPCESAFARMRSRFRPAPSSITSMQILPPWCSADSVRLPTSDLPAARRFSGDSMP